MKPTARDLLRRPYGSAQRALYKSMGFTDDDLAPGTVVVIRFMGPRGGPGMPEMYAPMKYVAARGLAANVAVITDWRPRAGVPVDGYLRVYAALAGPADRGATLEVDERCRS